MKNSIVKLMLILISLSSIVLLQSCDKLKSKKEALKNKFDLTGKMYSIVPKTTSVFWTGYKTTKKTPVKGQFMKVDITNIKKAKTAKKAIDGISFSIPVSSLFSNEESRDSKLKESFFGAMTNTEFIKGTIHIENDTLARVSLTMNAITKDVDLSYFIDGQMLSMDGNIDVSTWNALNALASLHKVCEEKHTGDDGVSKTWSDVAIHVASYLKVE